MAFVPTPPGDIPSPDAILERLGRGPGEPATGYIVPGDVEFGWHAFLSLFADATARLGVLAAEVDAAGLAMENLVADVVALDARVDALELVVPELPGYNAVVDEGKVLGVTIGGVAWVPNSEGTAVTSVLPEPFQGPVAGGTPVVLNGFGLLGATAVTFHGVAGSAFAVNAGGTQITVTTPPATAAGLVNVDIVGLPGVLVHDDFHYL